MSKVDHMKLKKTIINLINRIPHVIELNQKNQQLHNENESIIQNNVWLNNEVDRLKKRVADLTKNVMLLVSENKRFKKNSCFPAGHFYSPIVSVDDLKVREKEIWADEEKVGITEINLNDEKQTALLRDLSKFYDEIPFQDEKTDHLRYYFNNNFYAHTDAFVLYAMIRYLKPNRIIEIGSGHSSAIMLDTNALFFDKKINLTFIEPYTERLFSLISDKDRNNTEIIEKDLQVIELDRFKELKAGDILFIDSTHVVKTGSDVNYLLHEILPALNTGVYIHFHDIFYPFEYPKNWVLGGRNWNETYFLRTFLMYNRSFEIRLFPHYLHCHHSNLFKNIPLCYKNKGGCFWIEKTG